MVGIFGRRNRDRYEPAARQSGETERTAVEEEKGPQSATPTKTQVKRATRKRLIFSLITSSLLLIALVFLILVEVGNTAASDTVRNNIYFIRLNLTNIIPQTVPNSVIVNSIARTLGLHDYYQVGLWNFCEGYNDEGVTRCSRPQTLYWFNPVEIIVSELLAGATIALPTDVTDILNIIRLASNWMFGLFLSGTCLTFVLIFTAPLSVFSRWLAFFNGIFVSVAAILVTVASVIATVMFVIMRNAFTSVAELNIEATLGIRMFAFMYIAVAALLVAALITAGECCCCASRRDIRTGRKRGSRKAWNGPAAGADVNEKPQKRGFLGFGRRR